MAACCLPLMLEGDEHNAQNKFLICFHVIIDHDKRTCCRIMCNRLLFLLLEHGMQLCFSVIMPQNRDIWQFIIGRLGKKSNNVLDNLSLIAISLPCPQSNILWHPFCTRDVSLCTSFSVTKVFFQGLHSTAHMTRFNKTLKNISVAGGHWMQSDELEERCSKKQEERNFCEVAEVAIYVLMTPWLLVDDHKVYLNLNK
jgi:hypothetical protein